MKMKNVRMNEAILEPKEACRLCVVSSSLASHDLHALGRGFVRPLYSPDDALGGILDGASTTGCLGWALLCFFGGSLASPLRAGFRTFRWR